MSLSFLYVKTLVVQTVFYNVIDGQKMETGTLPADVGSHLDVAHTD